MGDFDGAWLKWGWAMIEAKALEADIRTFGEKFQAEGGLATSACKYEPDNERFLVYVKSLSEDFPERWGLRLGNVIQNYRSSLDHVAWQLVAAGHTPNLPNSKLRMVNFPLRTESSLFDDSLTRVLPGVGATEIAKVRRYQPYEHVQDPALVDHHALALLDELSRHDKHRTIQPVASFPFDGRIQVTYWHDCDPIEEIGPEAPRDKLEVGAKLGYVRVVPTGPDPDIRVKPQIRVKPTISDDIWLNEWLTKTNGLVALILSQFSDPPTKLLDALEPTA